MQQLTDVIVWVLSEYEPSVSSTVVVFYFSYSLITSAFTEDSAALLHLTMNSHFLIIQTALL